MTSNMSTRFNLPRLIFVLLSRGSSFSPSGLSLRLPDLKASYLQYRSSKGEGEHGEG